MIQEIDTMIEFIDLIFAIGTSCFLISTIPQVLKLYKVTYSDAQSLMHNEMQLIAMGIMLLGYFIIRAPISAIVTITQLIIRIHLIKLIRLKRRNKLTCKSDLIYYLKIGGRRFYEKIISRTPIK
jgi:hypothetical protein